MARPRKEGMEYFPHDTDARNDMKIRKLRAVFGNDGYAAYFILLENIYRNKDYYIDISDAETNLILSEECRISEDMFTKIILKCIDLDLFSKEEYETKKILTSEAIKKRTEPVENKRKRNKNDYNSKKEEVSDAETITEIDVSEAEIMSESTQRKEKNSKEKNSIVKENIIWDYYIGKMKELGKSRKKTDSKLKHIRARLTEFTEEELISVIDAVFNNDFMKGQNDRNKEYLDIDNFMCNTEKVEKWLDSYKHVQAINKNPWESMSS